MVIESEHILEEIRNNRTDGAVVLAARALDALAQFVREHHALSGDAFSNALLQFVKQIVALRPSMGAIGASALLALDRARHEVDDGMAWTDALTAAILFFREQMAKADVSIAEHAAAYCGTGGRILTCSHSSTVMSAFAVMRPGRVFIGAGEPLGDGMQAAKILATRGVPVTVLPDGALAMMVEKVDKVIIGVDQILSSGAVVNRAGTLAMALAASHFGVPVYALSHRIKISGVSAEGFEGEDMAPVNAYHHFDSVLPLFDVTPGEFIDAIITEKGPLLSGELLEITSEMSLLWGRLL